MKRPISYFEGTLFTFLSRRVGTVLIAILMLVSTSCEISPLVDNGRIEQAIEKEAKEQSFSAAVEDPYLMSELLLGITGAPNGGSLVVEIRDERGEVTLATTTSTVQAGDMQLAQFNPPVVLSSTRKYRIYVKLAARNPIGTTLVWRGGNTTDRVDYYLPGGSSATKGDFVFETRRNINSEQYRDQFSYTKGPGVILEETRYQWQEFVPLNPRLVLTFVELVLKKELEGPENVFVDIRSATGAVIGTSNPVSTDLIGSGFTTIRFMFSQPVIVRRGSYYQIYPRRSGFSIFPFYGVYWGLEGNGSFYRRGQASVNQYYDFAFATDINGDWDQGQGYHTAGWSPALSANQETSPYQTFMPGFRSFE